MSIKWDLYSVEPADTASLWRHIRPWKKMRVSVVKGEGGWQMAGRLKKSVEGRFLHTLVLCHVATESPLWDFNSPGIRYLLHLLRLHFKSQLLWETSPGPQKSLLWLMLLIIKVLSLLLFLLFCIGSWNTTDLVPHPIKCIRRISASLNILLIHLMKMASKQGNACKKSPINQKMLYPA